MKPIKYFSMFSGIGGFEYGMEQSNVDFECVGFCEVDKYATSIYTRHFPNHRNYGDATKIKTEELPDFDFLVGGFPCQAFSHAGLRRGFDDSRGTLFFEIARILKDKRPKYFLLENVRGLLHHNKGETFKTILEILSNLGYYVKWQVLNSKDFGVPQNRERIFIKGYSRRKCGGEILSFRRSGRENTGEVSNTYCRSNQLIVENIPQKVQKRKYDVDIPQLQKLLNDSKKQQGLTNQQVADELDLPVTNVAHWFRTDKYFSIPTKEIWFDLKNLLKITDDSFDKPLTEFVEVDGVYDMSNRCYSDKGIAPILKSTSSGELIKEHNRELLCVNKGAAQAQKVYDPQGISPTLSACGGGDGGKTGLYLVPNERKIQVVGNSSPSNHSAGRVLSPDGIGRTLTATDYKHPIRIIEDKQKSIKLRETTKKGYKEAYPYDGVLTNRGNRKIAKGIVRDQHCGCLQTTGVGGTVTGDFRIRKLTPKECERLQGFPDDWTKYGKDGELISDTQRYKCCGNAVTTNVITAIVNEVFKDYEKH